MIRTTVYLPEALKKSLELVAKARGCSKADLIRDGVRQVVSRHRLECPKIPLFSSGRPDLAEPGDEGLEGFGES